MALCFASICVIFHINTSFYNYLQFHTKCTWTYLHTSQLAHMHILICTPPQIPTNNVYFKQTIISTEEQDFLHSQLIQKNRLMCCGLYPLQCIWQIGYFHWCCWNNTTLIYLKSVFFTFGSKYPLKTVPFCNNLI